MPAKSSAQRRYLFMKFGSEWVRSHHFDTKGPLPEHVMKKKKGKKKAKKRAKKRARVRSMY